MGYVTTDNLRSDIKLVQTLYLHLSIYLRDILAVVLGKGIERGNQEHGEVATLGIQSVAHVCVSGITNILMCVITLVTPHLFKDAGVRLFFRKTKGGHEYKHAHH